MFPPNQNRSNAKRKGPLQDLPMNPFTSFSQLKNNYPGIDAVFKLNSSHHKNHNICKKGASSNKSRHSNLSISSPDRSSVFAPSDCLNMSIGARAAIYEQTHRINKYGLDGDEGTNSTDDVSSSPTRSTTQSTSDEWERLMDGVPCNTSIIADSHVSASFSYHKNNSSYTMDTYENQSDYFNSSTILKNLATPERNKEFVDEASRLAMLGIGVDVRGGGDGRGDFDESGGITSSQSCGNDSACHSESGSVSESGENTLEQSGMIGLFHAAMRLGEKGIREGAFGNEDNEIDKDDVAESFISFHEPNMSVVHLNRKPLIEESSMDFCHRGDGVTGDEEGDDFTDIQMDIDIQASFISYRDLDFSMMSRHDLDREGEGMNMHMHSKANSDFGHSDFDVDVSEIIAPSDIGSKLPSANYSSPFGKSFLGRLPSSPQELVGSDNGAEDILFSPFGTPIDDGGDQIDSGVLTPPSTPQIGGSEFLQQCQLEDEVGWPSASPQIPQSPMSSATEGKRDHNYTSNNDTSRQLFLSSPSSNKQSPMPNRSLTQQFDSSANGGNVGDIAEETILAAEIRSWHDDLATDPLPSHHKFESPSSPPRPREKGKDQLGLNANVSLLSPIQNQCSSEETMRLNRGRGKKRQPLKNVEDQLKVYDSVSPLTAQNQKVAGGVQEVLGENSRIVGPSPKVQVVKYHISQKMSLKDRYSRPDRFEDSYAVPSSASTLHSSPETYNGGAELSIHQSILETFENDYISSQERKEFSTRRFAV